VRLERDGGVAMRQLRGRALDALVLEGLGLSGAPAVAPAPWALAALPASRCLTMAYRAVVDNGNVVAVKWTRANGVGGAYRHARGDGAGSTLL
jgi:hypothetical protein